MRWLLLRGLGREMEHWGRFRSCLEERGATLELLDLPGAGTEFRKTVPLTIRGMVEDLRGRRKSSGEPIGLISVSLGGMVALDWSARYPSEIARQVIINSSTLDVAPPWKRLRPASVLTGLAFALARGDEQKEELTLRFTTGLRGEELRALAREWAGIRRLRPVSGLSVLRQLFAAFLFRMSELPRCPTLIVRSLGDQLAHPVCSERLARKLGAELLTHPSGGHDLSTDAPEWLAEQIMRWSGGSRPQATPRGPSSLG